MAEETVTEKKVTLKELAEQVGKLTQAVGVIFESQSQDKASGLQVTKPVEPAEGEPDASVIPPAWRRVVDEELGSDFGIHVHYPDEKSSGLFLFKVIVPREKSNAPQAHWTMYKTDTRTKNIAGNPSVDEIRKFCQRIKANLVMTQQTQLAK